LSLRELDRARYVRWAANCAADPIGIWGVLYIMENFPCADPLLLRAN
jgi:hypothetical protein